MPVQSGTILVLAIEDSRDRQSLKPFRLMARNTCSRTKGYCSLRTVFKIVDLLRAECTKTVELAHPVRSENG